MQFVRCEGPLIGNDASDEMGPETPDGTETSNGKGEGKSKGKDTTDATETVSHVD